MRLLIVTQTVAVEDPVLGFFLRWIEEFSKKIDYIEVICLKEGKQNLPQNVHVHSLGKEKGAKNRVLYVIRFLSLIWKLRRDYDAVFVHMNEEYVLLGGLFWRLLHKRVVLWRNHKMGSWRTRLAMVLSTVICHTSPDAFVTRSSKAVAMPVGIDTERFSPPSEYVPNPNSILFLGRLDPVKRVDVFINAVGAMSALCTVDVYGSSTDPESAYAQSISEQARPLIERDIMKLYPAVSHSLVPEIYRSHAIYVNLTPSGSFDKTIGEAMASGCVVVCANDAVRSVVRPELMVASGDAQVVGKVLEYAVALSDEERMRESRKLRSYIEEQHSLQALMRNLEKVLY